MPGTTISSLPNNQLRAAHHLPHSGIAGQSLVLCLCCSPALILTIVALNREGTFDTANPAYIRKYLRTYGLTPPRAENYETQKTRCMYNAKSGK